MRPAVCVPWFDTSDEHRTAAFECVLAYWQAHEWPVVVSSYATERAHARNEAAHAALALGHDVLVFSDADTLVPYRQAEAAVALAAGSDGLVYCYDLYCRLTREATAELVAHPAEEWPLLFERQYYSPPSIGCVAMSARTYLDTGGLDESYRGWGYEDLAFADACSRLGPLRRVPGPAFHLWHGERPFDPFEDGTVMVDAPADADPGQARSNRARWLEQRAVA